MHQCRLGATGAGKQLYRERSGILVDTMLSMIKDHEPAICHCAEEGWQQPVLHEEDHHQQVKGGDAFPLLSTGETTGVLPLVLPMQA